MNPFQHIIDEARTWVLPHWQFVEIGEIRWVSEPKRGGRWSGPNDGFERAHIRCGWEDTIDLVWHEVFHSVFHNCPMKRYDPLWMEGWCNAFAEIHIGKFQGTADDDSYHTRTYLIPCDKLLHQSDFDLSILKTMWLGWNGLNTPLLTLSPGAFSKYMGYTPMENPRKSPVG